MPLYELLSNLLNVLVQIANKMELQKIICCPWFQCLANWENYGNIITVFTKDIRWSVSRARRNQSIEISPIFLSSNRILIHHLCLGGSFFNLSPNPFRYSTHIYNMSLTWSFYHYAKSLEDWCGFLRQWNLNLPFPDPSLNFCGPPFSLIFMHALASIVPFPQSRRKLWINVHIEVS
jgi:hypothetical protein